LSSSNSAPPFHRAKTSSTNSKVKSSRPTSINRGNGQWSCSLALTNNVGGKAEHSCPKRNAPSPGADKDWRTQPCAPDHSNHAIQETRVLADALIDDQCWRQQATVATITMRYCRIAGVKNQSTMATNWTDSIAAKIS